MTAKPRTASVILAAVFVCAACGLVYELALVALGSYLLGNSITQTSLVLAVTMSAMGIGALAAKPLTRRPLRAFAAVELALAVIGGLSIPLLYAAFAWLHLYTPAMLVVAFLIGALIGAEIPLLMELLQRLRPRRASSAVADVTAVDYIGALIGGLAFPFLLLPLLGLMAGTIAVAAINALCALLVVIAGSTTIDAPARRRGRLAMGAATAVIATLLGVVAARADDFELSARQALYRDPIAYSTRSEYQEIVVTRGLLGGEHNDFRLFLDGDLQFSSLDEYRYHEMLVHPALAGTRKDVLVLGGGDGLALREVLRYRDVRSATLVDLDEAVVDVARDFEPISRLNRHSFADPRVRYLPRDAFNWVRASIEQPQPRFDAIVVDFPDPDSTATGKLYTEEMYGMLRRLLKPGGRIVVQAGSPYFAPRAFWGIEMTIRAAGFETLPYMADVPSFGTWGFVLASERRPRAALARDRPPGLRYVSDRVLRAATVFPADRGRGSVDVEPSTLLRPRILQYAGSEWVGY